MAGAIGLAIIFVFMCFVYLIPGLAAGLALLIYTGLILVLLNAFNIHAYPSGNCRYHSWNPGMAVDANVIIFARVREEVTTGISVKTSLEEMVSTKALSAIVDGNLTQPDASRWRGSRVQVL